ncbi:hypothetical protein WG904_17570 [Pedobacter sp. Du54]|uniref:hypothetical protein n=1 Tax=Pedobacter anseongensis TaxID=3133439 RepID=UPI00309A6572
METKAIANNKSNGQIQNGKANKSDFVNVNKEAEKGKVNEPVKTDGQPTAKTEAPKAENTQAQSKADEPKAEPTKKEIKAKLAEEKPVMNLDQMLKKIKDLTRLSNQRDKLSSTIDTLEAFEVAQMDEAEETNLNHFQGCTLTITDDNDREFTTKNPFIIKNTADNIKTLCLEKLGEVEGQINSTY